MCVNSIQYLVQYGTQTVRIRDYLMQRKQMLNYTTNAIIITSS